MLKEMLRLDLTKASQDRGIPAKSIEKNADFFRFLSFTFQKRLRYTMLPLIYSGKTEVSS